jgi:hypothetical protein
MLWYRTTFTSRKDDEATDSVEGDADSVEGDDNSYGATEVRVGAATKRKLTY